MNMRMTREEFCAEYGLTEDEFFGRVFIERSLPTASEYLEYLPEGISLDIEDLYLGCLKELPEGCSLKAGYIRMDSLKNLPEEYLIDAGMVTCKIILPTYKGSSKFYFGQHESKKSFERYGYIKEDPLKFLESDSKLERALAEYFLKNPQENL